MVASLFPWCSPSLHMFQFELISLEHRLWIALGIPNEFSLGLLYTRINISLFPPGNTSLNARVAFASVTAASHFNAYSVPLVLQNRAAKFRWVVFFTVLIFSALKYRWIWAARFRSRSGFKLPQNVGTFRPESDKLLGTKHSNFSIQLIQWKISQK